MTLDASGGQEVVLGTDRLLLRSWRVSEAAIQREMWAERDPRVPAHRRFELLRRFWGQGYATEASWAVVDWARSSGYERLWATVWDWNTASRRVLAKVGFSETDCVETIHGTNLVTTRRL